MHFRAEYGILRAWNEKFIRVMCPMMSGRLWRPGFAVSLMREDASQQEHSLRELFNGLRLRKSYVVSSKANVAVS